MTADRPEPCTTERAQKRHLSFELVEGKSGRTGRALCGQYARDEKTANARRYTRTVVVLAELPPCALCARAAEKAIKEA